MLKIGLKKRRNDYLSYMLVGIFVILLALFIFLAISVKKNHYINKDIFNDQNVNNVTEENIVENIPRKIKNISEKKTAASSRKLILAQNINKNSIFQNIPILMYHYVEDAPATTTLKGIYLDPIIFENQLQDIQSGKFETVFVSEIARSIINKNPLSDKSIALTFDDGYEDFYTTIFPLLKKYKIKATVYVIINALDKKGYLTKEQVRELSRSEFVEIGSHTYNHLDLNNLNKRRASSEIVDSKKALENISGKPVFTFCYPYGHFQEYDVKLASAAGYLGSVTTRSGINHSQNNIQTMTRLRPGVRKGQKFLNWLNSFYVKN